MILLFCVVAALLCGAHAQCPPGYGFIRGRCLLFQREYEFPFLEARLPRRRRRSRSSKDSIDRLGSENGYWTGAEDTVQEGQFRWIDGTPVALGAPFWARGSGETDEPQDDEDDCAAMERYDGYYFHNKECGHDEDFYPLCQREPILDECISPYELVAGGCFSFLNTISGTWDEARAVCGTSGGDLAIVNDCNLMAELIKFIQENNYEPAAAYWIGGRRSNGVWRWNDGSPMSMGVPFWGRSGAGDLQPDDHDGIEDCVELFYPDRYYFNDNVCSLEKPPLCEVTPIISTPTP